jgi:hypothetical protein
VLWIAKEAHGSYPAGADAHSGDNISGAGQFWDGQVNLDSWPAMAWYGYAGGWGEVGSFPFTTGPWGPNPLRSVPTFDSPACDLA